MTKMTIVEGAIAVNGAHIRAESENIVCIDVDLKAKYADVLGIAHGVYVLLGASRETMHAAHHDGVTSIMFPDYSEWRIYGMPSISRYTLQVTLIRE